MFVWPSRKGFYELSIFLPVSNLSVYPTLREKTEFVARIARAAAIFKVSNVILVEDGSEEDLNLFITILNYLLVPPYLRRKLIPLTKELSFAGALPPLNIPTHNPSNKKPEINDVREGVVRTAFGRKGKVFFGYKRYCLMLSEREIFPGERVLLKITSLDPLKCVEEEPSKTEIYIGYRVFHSGVNDLSQLGQQLYLR